MCRSCGGLVGAGETQCSACGAPSSNQPTAADSRRQVDRETLKYARAILKRPHKFTIIFLIANLFVFLLMWESNKFASTAFWPGFDESVLEAYGAKLNYLVNAPNYQWWRLIAPMFLHVNVIHLIFNMYGLMVLGPFVEKLYGSAKFVAFWVLTGIASLIASYLTVRPQLATSPLARFIFKAEDLPSAGASGALFGLVGVLFIFGIKFRHELPEGFKRAFGTGMLPIIFLNLFIGFFLRGFIDNAAHLGGLLSGAVLALGVDFERPDVRRTITTAWRTLQVLSLSIVVVGFYKVARNLNRPVPRPVRAVRSGNSLVFLNYYNVMTGLQEKAEAIIHNNDSSEVAATGDLARQAPAPDERSAELKERAVVILTRLAEAAAAMPSPSPNQEAVSPAQLDQTLITEYKEWKKQYNEWLKDAAKSYKPF